MQTNEPLSPSGHNSPDVPETEKIPTEENVEDPNPAPTTEPSDVAESRSHSGSENLGVPDEENPEPTATHPATTATAEPNHNLESANNSESGDDVAIRPQTASDESTWHCKSQSVKTLCTLLPCLRSDSKEQVGSSQLALR